MRECEGTGKNIEQAIANALLELKASREDVDIKILNEGGFLKKAKVLVSISEDALEKYEKRNKLKQNLSEENDEDFAESFVKNKIATVEEKKEEIVKEETTTESNYTNKEEKTESKESCERKISVEEFIAKFLNSLDLEANIEKEEDERRVFVKLYGEKLNDLIGHRGECMMAISYLMNLVCKTENRRKIVLDIENYRQKREESLVALAKRIANQVAKTKRYYKLEPMEASERRIIHLALQDDDRVTTLSKGEEPHRYLMVFPKEYGERD